MNGLSGVTALSGGRGFALTLQSDGTVFGWGNNSAGQLGDGSQTNRPKPVQASGLNGAIAVTAAGDHSVALKSDGSVWAWGLNAMGQLGDGSLNRVGRLAPVPVPGLPSGVKAIWAGSHGDQGFALAPHAGNTSTATPPSTAATPEEAGPPAVAPSDTPPSDTPAMDAPAPDATAPDTTAGVSPDEGDVQGAPDSLTDNQRADILSAVDRANAVWVEALQTKDSSVLSAGVAGQLLDVDMAEVDQLRRIGQTMKNVNNAFTVASVMLDAPGHAVVQTSETWYTETYDAATGELLDRSPLATYDETYTVEYLSGAWIVTKIVFKAASSG